MTTAQGNARKSRSARPFGSGLKDPDLRLMVAATDVRYRQKIRAVIVRRSAKDVVPGSNFAVELIVLNTAENVEELKREAHILDMDGRLEQLTAGDIVDVALVSAATGERVMITSFSPDDFKRVEQVASLEQIHIGGIEDRGSWVCRIIDADRLDALFSGRFIDIRAHAG